MFALYHSHLPRWYANVHSLPTLNLSYYRSYIPHTVTKDTSTSFYKLCCYSPCNQKTMAIVTASRRAFSVTSMTINNTGNTNEATTTQPLAAKYKPQYLPFFVRFGLIASPFPAWPAELRLHLSPCAGSLAPLSNVSTDRPNTISSYPN